MQTQINSDLVKSLREKTNAGIMDCKRALQQAGGDFDQAVQILKGQGLLKAQNKSERRAAQGLIYSYIHSGGKIGVLLEINCETDFVARNKTFQDLAKDIALQIAGAHPAPLYVSRDAVTPEDLARWDKEAVFLLDQPFIKEPSITIRQLVHSKISEIGENIVVRRFVRFQLGETSAQA